MWAMPNEDQNVMNFYNDYEKQFQNPGSLAGFVENSLDEDQSYSAVFIPGGHGAMLGIPEDPNVGKVLRWADDKDLYTITLCHGPGALLSTNLEANSFIYKDYQMAVFPDSVDKQTPMVGYLPGHMPWKLCEKLTDLGVKIVNKKSDNLLTKFIGNKLLEKEFKNLVVESSWEGDMLKIYSDRTNWRWKDWKDSDKTSIVIELPSINTLETSESTDSKFKESLHLE